MSGTTTDWEVPTSPSVPNTVTSAAPTTPPALVCGNASLLSGPTQPPAGAVVVTPSEDLNSVTQAQPPGTTFWLAPGVYTLGTGQYNQVIPQSNDSYIGAPGAVIDGQHDNLYAFTQQAQNVTIEYLTIQNFGQPGDNNNEGVVNHDSGQGWLISHDTIQHDAGAGVMLGSNDVLSFNCLTSNGQYGFSAYSPQGVSSLTVEHNEISFNNTDNWEVRQPGCGCSGGGKFWDTSGATVTDNYVHDNLSVGLWADTNNTGFDIEGNYIANNYAEGVIYEISYNARIADNTFIRNALGQGPNNPGFPTAALYLSESGSDSRVPGPYGTTFEITGNTFTDNWAGVVLWESADRFCNSPANTSHVCTLVDPSVATLTSCNSVNIALQPYYGDCRWKTQNVSVDHNTFNFDPAAIGTTCTAANNCGLQGLFSQWGTYPSWSPYQGPVIENAIATSQNDHFADNAYQGPWMFMVHDQGSVVPFSTWQTTWKQDTTSNG